MVTHQLQRLVVPAQQAASLITNGMLVAMSGYSAAGYPKAVVEELVVRKQSEPELTIDLLTAANAPWLDEQLGAAGLIGRRTPMCASRGLASRINSGSVRYVEQQMNRMPALLKSGSFGTIDIAVIEALGFDEEGNLIPTNSIGMNHLLMAQARRIIIEINSTQPQQLKELHDIFIPAAPPDARPLPLLHAGDRIGSKGLPIDRDKICAIVHTDIPEEGGPALRTTPASLTIADHLMNFLEIELRRTGGVLPPLQTGFGTMAHTVAEAFGRSSFRDLQFFCGGIGEAVLELMYSGTAAVVSTGGFSINERVRYILEHTENLSDRLILRNGDLINNAEIIGRLGVIALNTGIEIDIYGNVNSSHIAGTRVVNGIGGGANFAQNAGLSVILLLSNAKSGAISNIVPMVSHQDICEHDVDIIISEHGTADLRGLDDGQRADAVIEHCTAGVYQQQLKEYLQRARKSSGGHHPQLPEEAFSWYRRLKEEGTMVENR